MSTARTISMTARKALASIGSKWDAHGADILKAAIGALIGASLAFYAERYSRNEEADQKDLQAGLLVVAVLENMEHTLFANYCVNVLPQAGSKRAWLDLGTNPGDFPSAEALDGANLSFLLPKSGLEIYWHLADAQVAYREYAALVSRRNRLLVEVTYPATTSLPKNLAPAESDKRISAAIGISPIEQAHQAALVMLATHRYLLVIGKARSVIHSALRARFPEALPTMPPLLWPSDKKTPDCSVIERDGSLARVRFK